jgi:hypothetical protein
MGIWDVVAGTVMGVVTNIIPGSTALRNSYTPTDAADYNNALQSTDAVAMAAGEAMVKGGGGAAATGLVTAAAGGAVSLTGVGAVVGGPTVALGLGVAEVGTATAAGGAVLMVNGAANASAGYNYGENGNSDSNSTSKETKTRQSQGSDGATSTHIIEKDASGNTVSKTHQVTSTEGEVVHQHQDHVSQTPASGQKPTMRRFPDEWVEYPSVNAK